MPWNLLQHSTATGSIDQPYQYVGQLGYYTHYMVPGSADLRLLQLGVRFYDPLVGRFTQQDPIRDGINWYGYVDGNPVNHVDPWGLRPGYKIDAAWGNSPCWPTCYFAYNAALAICVKKYDRTWWWRWIPYFGTGGANGALAACEWRAYAALVECIMKCPDNC